MVEKAHAVPIGKIRSMPVAPGQFETLWVEAANYVVRTFNRTNATGDELTCTPYRSLHGEPPSVAHIRVFGCLAFAFV